MFSVNKEEILHQNEWQNNQIYPYLPVSELQETVITCEIFVTCKTHRFIEQLISYELRFPF